MKGRYNVLKSSNFFQRKHRLDKAKTNEISSPKEVGENVLGGLGERMTCL